MRFLANSLACPLQVMRGFLPQLMERLSRGRINNRCHAGSKQAVGRARMPHSVGRNTTSLARFTFC
jgi:hypothetical protein